MTSTDTLTPAQGQALVQLARHTLETNIGGGKLPTPELDPRLQEKGASFVTLTVDGALRGCIGTAEAHSSLVEDVKKNALHAARSDPRFAPVTAKDLDTIHVEVSVLTPPRPLDCRPEERAHHVRPGADGLLLTADFQRGLLLPQVWGKIPDPIEFLSVLCQKAGLGRSAWQRSDTELYTFQVQAFHEE